MSAFKVKSVLAANCGSVRSSQNAEPALILNSAARCFCVSAGRYRTEEGKRDFLSKLYLLFRFQSLDVSVYLQTSEELEPGLGQGKADLLRV